MLIPVFPWLWEHVLIQAKCCLSACYSMCSLVLPHFPSLSPCVKMSVLLPCYLGLEIKRLSCCCHAVCLQCLNALVSWCLPLTTSWQLPNKTEWNQATTVMMTNHFAQRWEGRKGMVLWFSVFLLSNSTTPWRGQISSCKWPPHAALLLCCVCSARTWNWME